MSNDIENNRIYFDYDEGQWFWVCRTCGKHNWGYGFWDGSVIGLQSHYSLAHDSEVK